MPKTEMVSLRIEPNLRKELKLVCKSHNCTMSDVMRDGIIHKTGGAIKLFEPPDPNNEVANFLTTLGSGSIVGILSYKAVYGALKNKFGEEKDDTELQTYAVICGVASALLTGYGVSQLFKLTK